MAFDVNQFFESVDIILTQRLADLSYDKTVIATIIDDDDKEKGHYVVSDGTIKFDAYSNDDSYKVDDQVRITVLNGDWSQKKFISGKYSDKDTVSTVVKYMPPLGTTMQDTHSTLTTNTNLSWNLIANGSVAKQSIWSMKITPESKYYALQANGIYNVITLQGDFCTNMGPSLMSGNYGLLLELFITPEENSNTRIRKFITFDSSEMLGNPYSFVINSRQSKQIAIASEGIVTEVILSIYQGKNFSVSNGALVEEDNPFLDYQGNRIASNKNITFSNVIVGFGSDLTQIEDNKLQIYTTSSPAYHYNGGAGDDSNYKTMGLVWYNKTDDNQYLGFSDGIYDPNYDEIQYLETKWADVRLINQKGKSNIPTDELSLNLAANITEAEPLMTNVYSMLTTDLSNVLQAIGRSIGGTTLKDDLDKIISSYKENGVSYSAKLVQHQNTAKTAVQNLVSLYKDVLQYGYNVQNNISTEWKTEWNNTAYYNTFSNAITAALTEVTTFMTSFDIITRQDAVLAGYRGVYESYVLKVTAAINAVQTAKQEIKCITTFNGIEEDDEYWLQSYKAKTSFTPYAEPDLTGYDNKYTIYWYRYNPNYNLSYIDILTQSQWEDPNNRTEHSNYNAYVSDCEKNNREYKFGQFLGSNWERVSVAYNKQTEQFIAIKNFGLPTSQGKTTDGVVYYPASPASEQFLCARMNPVFAEERYQAVLFYNHNMFKSNVITFTNTEADLIPIEFNVDANDVLVIEHGAHSQEHYQSYTSAFDLVNIADESRLRDLIVSYDGVSSGNETLAGAEIYWYMPINSTMLTYDEEHLKNTLGFIVCKDTDTPYSKNGYIYFYKQIKYTSETVDATDVDGKPIYNADGTAAKDNKITIDEADRHFVYKIKPFYEASAQNNNIIVEAYVHGQNGEVKVTSGEIFFTFSTFGSNGTKYTLTLTPATTQVATLPQSSLSLNLALRDADNNLIELNDSAIGNINAEPNTLNTYQLRVDWYAKNKNPSAINLQSITDSKMKLVSIGNPVSGNTSKYMGVVQAKVSYKTEGRNATTPRTITLSTLQPISYASSAAYYISGPTTIVYNNQGTVSRLSEEPFRLYERVNGTETVKDKQTWSLLYYDKNGDEVTDTTILKYLPTLNGDNTLMPAPMYYNYDNTFYVPVAKCVVDGEIAWTQPIIITQNQYASSTLNDWNGQFEINEENGTILSTMVGAGRKAENNAFEGVLMGDIELGANVEKGQADGIGLYGFNEGAQSFFFGVNGKAFIGKAGAGRLCFDGNNGFLYSGNWLSSFDSLDDAFKVYSSTPRRLGLNQGKDGLAIDLQQGHIDAYNFKVTSKNIYLNSNPIDKNGEESYYFRIGHNGSALSDSYSDLNGDAIQPTRGYMALNKSGDLEIRANSLSITGQLGGVNLLLQTEPKRTIPTYKEESNGKIVPNVHLGAPRFDWNVALKNTYNAYKSHQQSLGLEPLKKEEWKKVKESTPQAWTSQCTLTGSYPTQNEHYWSDTALSLKKYYIAVQSNSTPKSISQTVAVKGGEYYTVSGYTRNLVDNTTGTLKISFKPYDASGNALSDAITVPLWSEGNDEASIKGSWEKFEHTIKFANNVASVDITFSASINFALWHAKFESGAISSAWSPAPQDTEDNIAGNQNKYDVYLNQDRVFDKLITDDNGEKMVGIWLLDGEGSASGHNELYINATYMSTGILRSSNWDGKLQSKKLYLPDGKTPKTDALGNEMYTYEIQSYPTRGLYLNLDEGKMWAAKFELTAYTDTNKNAGLYLKSDPTNSERWFYVGDSSNHIDFGKDSKGKASLTLVMNKKFTLTAGTQDTDDYLGIFSSNDSGSVTINNVAKTDWRLLIGKQFGVDKAGNVYASNITMTGSGTFSGAVTATSGTFTGTINASGGTITGNMTVSGTLTGGTISGASISGSTISGGSITIGSNFSVDTDGNLSATNGSFTGTITASSISAGSGTSTYSLTSGGVLSATGVNIAGTVSASGGSIGGWTINETTISNGSITLNSKGGITVGDTVLTSTGFSKTDGGLYPTVSNVKVWTGWSDGWGKLNFVNGLLSSYENTGLDAGEGNQSAFKFAASVDEDLTFGDDTWALTLSPTSGNIGADGKITLSCTLKPPKTLYTTSAATVTTQGQEYEATTRYYYASSSGNITYSTRKPASGTPYAKVTGHFTSSNRYGSGTTYTSKYYTRSSYCTKNSSITGKVLVTIS